MEFQIGTRSLRARLSGHSDSAEYLQERHGVPAELIKNLAGVGALIAKAVE